MYWQQTEDQAIQQIVVPEQINNRQWRSLLTVNANKKQKQLIQLGIYKIKSFLSKSIDKEQLNLALPHMFESQIYKSLFKFHKKIYKKIKAQPDSKYQNDVFKEIAYMFYALSEGETYAANKLFQLDIVQLCKNYLTFQADSILIRRVLRIISNLSLGNNNTFRFQILQNKDFFEIMDKNSVQVIEAYRNFEFDISVCDTLNHLFLVGFRSAQINQNQKFRYTNLFSKYLNIISKYMQRLTNDEITIDLMTIIRQYVLFFKQKKSYLLVQQIFKIISRFLQSKNSILVLQFLQIIGKYIAVSDDAIEQAFKIDNFTNKLLQMICQEKIFNEQIRSCSAWILSNIIVGREYQLKYIFQSSSNLIKTIEQRLNVQKKQNVIKQLIWIVAQLFRANQKEILIQLLNSRLVQLFLNKYKLVSQMNEMKKAYEGLTACYKRKYKMFKKFINGNNYQKLVLMDQNFKVQDDQKVNMEEQIIEANKSIDIEIINDRGEYILEIKSIDEIGKQDEIGEQDDIGEYDEL